MHFDQTPSFSNSEVSFLRYTSNRKLKDGTPLEFDQMALNSELEILGV